MDDETRKQNEDNIDFPLMLGGPLYRFYLWTHLVKDPLLLFKRRMIIICLFAWLPLFIISLLNGVAFADVNIPFIYDIDVHVRFLLSLALLIYAEVVVHDRLQTIVSQFLKCNIISPAYKQKFKSIIVSTKKWETSVLVEILLIVFVITVGHFISRKSFPLDVETWYATQSNAVTTLTPAGYWYAFVSLPIFQFFLLRWYYRMAIWYRFLWQVSRLPLQLNSLHPDGAGGIGFLNSSLYAFEPLLLAHSVLLAGIILNRIWNAGAVLTQFHSEIIGLMVFLILLPTLPLLFFTFILAKYKSKGTLEYSVVANRYVNDFRQKWLTNREKNSELMLGSSDIQSLADLTNSFQVSARMSILLISKRSLLFIILVTALPLIPLVFTMMSLDKFVKQVIGIIF